MSRIKLIWEFSGLQSSVLNDALSQRDMNHTLKFPAEYVLKVSKDAELNCPPKELVDILYDAIKLGGFDTLYLDNFASVAMLYRINPKGLPTYAILPELFIKKRLTNKLTNKTAYGKKSDIFTTRGSKRDTGTENQSVDEDIVKSVSRIGNMNVDLNRNQGIIPARNSNQVSNQQLSNQQVHNNQQLIVREEGGSGGILLAAFTFFVIVILAGVYVVYGRRRGRRIH